MGITLKLLSDLHLEFQSEEEVEVLAQRICAKPTDVLVLAGDISPILYGQVSTAPLLDPVCSRFQQVIYVPGNHEYYGSSVEETNKALDSLDSAYPNLHVLRNSSYSVDGFTFHGSTLWFAEQAATPQHAYTFSDFRYIHGFDPWVFEENRRSIAFLRRAVSRGDIIITHHVPLRIGVAEKWHRDVLSPLFFHSDLVELVTKLAPTLWHYGHTHDTHDFVFKDTIFICNPLGYPGENAAFNPDKFITLG